MLIEAQKRPTEEIILIAQRLTSFYGKACQRWSLSLFSVEPGLRCCSSFTQVNAKILEMQVVPLTKIFQMLAVLGGRKMLAACGMLRKGAKIAVRRK